MRPGRPGQIAILEFPVRDHSREDEKLMSKAYHDLLTDDAKFGPIHSTKQSGAVTTAVTLRTNPDE
jgi:hypothetical protein